MKRVVNLNHPEIAGTFLSEMIDIDRAEIAFIKWDDGKQFYILKADIILSPGIGAQNPLN